MSFFEQEQVEDKRSSMYIWVEKYRPQSLDEYLGNEQIKQSVATWLESGEIPHLLFYSRKPGTGKCLSFDEYIDIEMEVSDDEHEILKNYEIK